MTKLRQWSVLTGVLVVAVLAAGWFLLISPKRAEAADLRQQAADQQQATRVLKNKLAVLQEQAKELPKKQAELAAVTAKLPSDPAQPALLRALAAAADAAGVDLVSVTPSALTAVTTPAATTSTAPSTSTSDAPSVTTPTTAGGTTSGGTLMAMPVALTVFGGYFEMEQYVAALEDLPRAFRVTGLTLTPGASPVQTGAAPGSMTDDGQHLTAAITGNVFVAVGADPAAPVVAPAASTGN